MKKIICPFCFHKFRKADVWFRCDNNSCSHKSEDKALNDFWGQNQQRKNLAFKPEGFSLFGSESAKCPKCKTSTLKVICPECHNSLFKDMIDEDSTIISIIGGQSSGKTNYITVLIQELLNRCYTFDAAITEITACGDVYDANTGKAYNTAHRYREDFYNQLYNQKVCHAATRRDAFSNRIPLIYRLVIGKHKKSVFLVFYDTAGENFHTADEIRKNAEFLKNSAGIIFLLDTFGIDDVNKKLGNISNKSYRYIFDPVVNYMQNNMSSAEQNEFKKKPLALAFSKIDTILNDKNYDIPGINMQTNSSFLSDEKISLNDLYAMHIGLNDTLRGKWDEKMFLKNIKTNLGEKVCFFGFSALGEMPNIDGSIKNVKPYRVLDPLVWILHELGYPIPLKKEKTMKKDIKV